MESFSTKTTWGCPRRWWYRAVQGLEEQQNANQSTGVQIHSEIEGWFKSDGKAELRSPTARSGLRIFERYLPGVMGIERGFEGGLEACGIPFSGKIDLLSSLDGVVHIVDWKTTTNVKRASPKMPTTQQIGYAKWWLDQRPGEAVVSSLVYLETTPEPQDPKIKSVELDEKIVSEHWTNVEETVRQMIDVAKVKVVEEVPFNLRACRVGPNVCSYFDRCPKGGLDLMSLFDEFSKPAAVPPPPKPKQDYSLITPPDLPPPAPTPPETPKAIEQAEVQPKKRGRPPGSKNRKMEIQDVSPEAAAKIAEAVLNTPVPEASLNAGSVGVRALTSEQEVTYVERMKTTKVTVRHGATINLGNYQSARVEVELEALVGDDSPEFVREKLGEHCRKALVEECKPYQQKREEPKP